MTNFHPTRQRQPCDADCRQHRDAAAYRRKRWFWPLFGCNLAFATPVAYQTNILIMSAGGYQFRDYVRAGLPLVILMVVTLSVLLVLRYGI
jgi:hypothetical protein